VADDPEAMQELEKLGYYSTPVTLVGEEVVVGFDKQRLRVLLGLE
jgi:hypothetical protein